ncbi:WD-40 repeat-containing protein MSI2-like [Impatiens glandulifera]|uniref:WD-40 repeat-containing protein MSI2-like n=1 Tax=Impatiens glandulifera TaxID=253017 RepID=UPI001FB0F46E|nr:WD-40 repeat-containing protein MSI2-like [Impatiens glandulifera]
MGKDIEQSEASGGDLVEAEFAVWKKNTPFLYDLVISHPLEWPSLTVQWLPSPPKPYDDGSFSIHKMILGTHTSDDAPNFLMVADVHIPCNSAIQSVNTDNLSVPKVEIIQKIRVDGELNRARCMPQNPSLVAGKTNGCEVFVFDCSKHQLVYDGSPCNPDLRLKGHDQEGFGLSWSPFKEGHLLSGSNDRRICLWDVSAMPQDKVLNAKNVYEAHKDVVGDVSWNLKNENIFGSVGDDGSLIIWDLRTSTPQQSVQAHEKEVNYLSFNSYNEWVVATASSDATVGLFDIRKLTSPLHVMSGHTEEVFQVEWDPNHETVLASSADDRRLIVWDINRIGDEQLEGEAEDGVSELLFSHGGHKAKISDFSWNKNEAWVISSVAEDNALQVWQMAESIYHDDAVE